MGRDKVVNLVCIVVILACVIGMGVMLPEVIEKLTKSEVVQGEVDDDLSGNESENEETSSMPELIMQTMTSDDCSTRRTVAVDARDNKTYWVRKIPGTGINGEGDLCWMETNLAYRGGGNNTYGDVRTMRADWIDSATEAMVRIDTPVPYGAPRFTTHPTLPTTGSGIITGANGAQYGYLYNWCAAMGGQPKACKAISVADFDTDISVCPAGWRLPTVVGVGDEDEDSISEFYQLNRAVNSGVINSDRGLRHDWLGVYSGYYWNTGARFAGQAGFYWSSHTDSANIARYFSHHGVNASMPESQFVFLTRDFNRAAGMAVRCVQKNIPSKNEASPEI